LLDAEMERVAQRLYAEVPALSQCNARRLVYDFGAESVARTWQWLRSQPFYAEIRNPAGYLIRKVEGQALKKRTTINPQEFHGQSYKFHDWHPAKPLVDCQCQYCGKQATTKTPFEFCSPECETRSQNPRMVIDCAFWDNGGWLDVPPPAGGWRLDVETVFTAPFYPHLQARVKLGLDGQFETEARRLWEPEPAAPEAPVVTRLSRPRNSAQITCPLSGLPAWASYRSGARRCDQTTGRFTFYWRYQVFVSETHHFYYLCILEGEDIQTAPAAFIEELKK
jgi:hypothetical protein